MIEELERAIKEAEVNLQYEEAMLDMEKREFQKFTNYQSDLTAIHGKSEEISIYNEKFHKKYSELQKLQFLFESKQLKLLSELQTVYPIEINDSQVYTIRGVELYHDIHSQRDDEHISTALGYIAHVVLLASKYLEIPLRYQILFYASRSFIRDPIATNGQGLPLYRRGSDRERFDRAVIWLKKDIEQLLLTRNIPYENNRDMLYNLKQLFTCESCCSIAF